MRKRPRRTDLCGTSFDVSSGLSASVSARGNVRRRVFRLKRLSACGTSDDVSSGLSASARAETSFDVPTCAERPQTYLPTWAPQRMRNVRRRIVRLGRLSACGTSFDVFRLERLSALRVRKRPASDLSDPALCACGDVFRRTDLCDSARAETSLTYLPTWAPQRMRTQRPT